MLTHNDIKLLGQLVRLPGFGYPLCNNADIQLVESLVDIIRAQHTVLVQAKTVVDKLNAGEIGFNNEFFSLKLNLNDAVNSVD